MIIRQLNVMNDIVKTKCVIMITLVFVEEVDGINACDIVFTLLFYYMYVLLHIV